MIHTGDAIEVMRGMPADSVDAVVTDPPYALTSIGRTLQMSGESLHPRGSIRSNQRGSAGGFMGRNWDAPDDGTPRGFQAWCTEWGTEALRVTKPGGYLLAFGGTRTHHRLVCGLEDAGWIIRDELTWIYASGFPKGRANLKPAHEPIVLARKPGPLRPLGIDACRIGYESGEVDFDAVQRQGAASAVYVGGAKPGDEVQMFKPAGRWPSNLLLSDPALFDEPNPEVVGSGATVTSVGRDHMLGDPADSGGYSRFFIVPKADRTDREPVLRGSLPAGLKAGYSGGMGQGELTGLDAKLRTKTVRENSHATVKPTDLMRHLVRLVTPSGGTVLDPFLGSGSTAIAAELEGFPWIGIEKEPEYVAIAEARLNGTQRGLGLDVPA